MKVYISKNTWCPCYRIESSTEECGSPSELTKEEYEFTNKTLENFEKIQDILEKAYNKGATND